MPEGEIIKTNIGLVGHVIKDFKNTGIEYDDLHQIGCIGLLFAARKFDASKNIAFSTLAVLVIKRSIWKYIRDIGKAKRKPKEPNLPLDKVNDDGIGLADVLHDRVDNFEHLENKLYIKQLINKAGLGERELKVVIMISSGMRQVEVAKIIGTSQPHCGRIYKESIQRLRACAGD